jgi:catechol 2,3-dioxygenase-like lactoylglutathione lyase family enzyme
MRTAFLLLVGAALGAWVQDVVGQQRNIVSLNHVAIAVQNFDQTSEFYSQGLGFPVAFSFREPDGRPTLTYHQVSRNTFIELMPTAPDRPTGFVHFGLEVSNLDAVVKQLRGVGMDVRDPTVSPRTKSRIAVARTPEGSGVELLEFGPDSLHRKVMDSWK